MFHSARIRLTLWYLVIIAIISVSFSALIYQNVSMELTRGFIVAEYRLRGQLHIPPDGRVLFLVDELARAKNAVVVRLGIMNGIILVMSGVAGYFLAGKALMPLEEAIYEQKRFVDDASHELKTPLTTMRSEIEVALREKKLTSKAAKSHLASSLEEVEKMQRLINYLLTLSRYEKSQRRLLVKKLDLALIAEDTVKSFSARAAQEGIKLETKFEKAVAPVNRTSISELLSILIDNAIKYTPKGGTISVTTSTKHRKAVMKVSDTGVGITDEDLPHIFDRFYRVDQARCKSETDGYGLGLAIAKTIAGIHNADIVVKSKPGKGSVFTVAFS